MEFLELASCPLISSPCSFIWDEEALELRTCWAWDKSAAGTVQVAATAVFQSSVWGGNNRCSC